MGVPPALCAPQRGYGREQPQGGLQGLTSFASCPHSQAQNPIDLQGARFLPGNPGLMDEALALQGYGTCTWPRYLQTPSSAPATAIWGPQGHRTSPASPGESVLQMWGWELCVDAGSAGGATMCQGL